MSHFYGRISESARKTQPTARAHHSLRVEAQSWQGKIVTRLIREKDGDYFEVWREPHGSSGGDSILLKKGRVDLKGEDNTKKYSLNQIHQTWKDVYGENMKEEYSGFFKILKKAS